MYFIQSEWSATKNGVTYWKEIWPTTESDNLSRKKTVTSFIFLNGTHDTAKKMQAMAVTKMQKLPLCDNAKYKKDVRSIFF